MINDPVNEFMDKNHPLLSPLGVNWLNCPGIHNWRHPELKIWDDLEGVRHITFPEKAMTWVNFNEPAEYGGVYDTFDDDFTLPSYEVKEGSTDCREVMKYDPEKKYPNGHYGISDDFKNATHQMRIMRNRTNSEIEKVLFPLDFYKSTPATLHTCSGDYCSTTNLSIEEKLQIARDALKWLRDNHHEGNGEFEDKVANVLKETE